MTRKTNPDIQRRSRQSGFSMIEILVVIGIIGILVGFGGVTYVSKLSESRLSTGIQILNANFRQARQSAISMRQNRRVVLDAGLLSGMDSASGSSQSLTGTMLEPAQVWVEGKRCEEYPFDSNALCLGSRSAEPNAFPLTDPEIFPDGLMIADVDGRVPGRGNTSRYIYFEFNARGSIAKVYFDGEEAQTLYNQYQPVIHLARTGEIFNIGSSHGDYLSTIEDTNLDNNKLKWGDTLTEEAKERYKVMTIEVVRLTGKTRTYDYAIMNPWPIDQFIKQQ